MHTKHLICAILIALCITVLTTPAQTGAAIMARDEATEGGGAASKTAQGFGSSVPAGKPSARGGKTAKTPSKKSPAKTTVAKAPAKPKTWDGFVVGDKYTFLNFEVVSAEKPWHTREAKAAGASGLVQVEVLIDTNGKVIQARARTGNKLLHTEAERAALASTFNRPTFGGKPARAIGFLVYRFGPEAD